MTCLLLRVYVYFWSKVFRFQGGWVGLKKSEHCSDFENTYVFMDAPLGDFTVLLLIPELVQLFCQLETNLYTSLWAIIQVALLSALDCPLPGWQQHIFIQWPTDCLWMKTLHSLQERLSADTYSHPFCCCSVLVVTRLVYRNNQSLKGAVVVTLCKNEADVKFPMEIDRVPHRKFNTLFPLEIILLPHSGRGSRQLLLLITETSDFTSILKTSVY